MNQLWDNGDGPALDSDQDQVISRPRTRGRRSKGPKVLLGSGYSYRDLPPGGGTQLRYLDVLVVVPEVHQPVVGSDGFAELPDVDADVDVVLPDLPTLEVTLESFLQGEEGLPPEAGQQRPGTGTETSITIIKTKTWLQNQRGHIKAGAAV